MTSPLTISAPYLFLFFVVTVGAQDFNEAIQAAEERLAQKIEDSIASKDAEIALLKQRLNVILLIYKVSQQVPNNFIAIFQVLETKATKVIFSAMKGPESGTNFYGDITYDHLVLNLGNGFNIENGIFTVPISGTYRFSFDSCLNFEIQNSVKKLEFSKSFKLTCKDRFPLQYSRQCWPQRLTSRYKPHCPQ